MLAISAFQACVSPGPICVCCRIFQSYGATNTQSNNENVCITVPPVISVTLHKTHLDESHCNVLIDHTRLNLGVSFFMELVRFFLEATPFEPDASTVPNNGVVNYGYMEENAEVRVFGAGYPEGWRKKK